MNKVLERTELERTYLNIIKALYVKPTATILYGAKLERIPLKQGTWQGWSLVPLFFNTVLKALATATSQETEILGTQVKEEKAILPICRYRGVIHKWSPKFYQKLLEMIDSFSKVVGYKINLRKLIASLNTTNKHAEKEVILTHSLSSHWPQRK